MYMKIIIDKQEIKLVKAFTFYKALIGFMFKKNINYALIFKTTSIHTFFMKEAIDVIQTDKNYNVIRTYKNLKKNQIILPQKNIYYTIELPNNTIKTIKKGDKLIIVD